MSRFQVLVVVLCLVMNVVEGFDILVMAIAASGVAGEWHLSGLQIGLRLSSGLIGSARWSPRWRTGSAAPTDRGLPRRLHDGHGARHGEPPDSWYWPCAAWSPVSASAA